MSGSAAQAPSSTIPLCAFKSDLALFLLLLVAAAVSAAGLAAALLALLSLLVRLGSTAIERRREAGLLAVLGLPVRTVRRLLVARTAPPVLLAVLLGAAGGALASRALAPALGTRDLAGATSGTPIGSV